MSDRSLLALRLLIGNSMNSRQWKNLSKYFYDISKLIVGVAVVSQLANLEKINMKVVAIGLLAGICFLLIALFTDKKRGETDDD